jgi:hypothetical protein
MDLRRGGFSGASQDRLRLYRKPARAALGRFAPSRGVSIDGLVGAAKAAPLQRATMAICSAAYSAAYKAAPLQSATMTILAAGCEAVSFKKCDDDDSFRSL